MKKCTWTAVLAAGLLCINPFPVHAQEVIPSGVYVGSFSLEGLTKEEAEETVRTSVEEKMSQTITLDVNGTKAEASAEELGLSWDNPEAVEQAAQESRLKGNLIKRYMKQKDLQENPLRIELEMNVDQEKVSAFVSEKCGAAIAEPKNAVIVKEGDNFIVTPSVTGIVVDIEATKAALNAALNEEGTEGVIIEAAVTEQEPEITTEDLSSIQDVLGTYTTSFSSSGWSRSTNLEVGTAKINGRVLMPGEVLSGYECLAPFTIANGYKTATAYENGRSVDSIGGGVCQIATTLYNASLYAELDIVQRQNHSMTVNYVDHSRDAAIAGTYKDIKVSNPYDTPIYVEGTTEGKKLTFTIYGKETRPENRTIEFESKTLQWIDPGAPTEQPDPALAPGQRVKVQSSHTGIRSELYKCVYVDGTLQDRTLLNKDNYNASKAIYRVGPAVPVVAEPAAPVEGVPSETPTPVETAPQVQETPPEILGPGAPGASVEPNPSSGGPGAPDAPIETAPVAAENLAPGSVGGP